MTNADVVAMIYSELLKIAGGVTIVLGALSAFLGKVWISRIASRETQNRETAITELKAQLDRQGTEFKAQLDRQAAELKAKLDIAVQRTVHVDKMQFEHEYEIYKNAWERLFALQQATLQLRPMLDHIDPTESKEERMKKRMGNVREPYNAFSALVETNKPFYPQKVYGTLVAVRNKCHEEVIDYEYTERPHKEYWSEARKSQEEILSLIDKCCEAIRDRISEVRVA